jgi:hypothetical protein
LHDDVPVVVEAEIMRETVEIWRPMNWRQAVLRRAAGASDRTNFILFGGTPRPRRAFHHKRGPMFYKRLIKKIS